MTKPKLTIGVPTFNRPDFLPKALRSALGQSRPTRVIVTDNGDPGPTEEILASEEFAGQDITYIKTVADSAWPNWRAAAQAAETDYFAWLQDDDVVRDTYAERIIDVMDYFPDANLWLARLACAFDDQNGMPYKGNFPWVPMDMLHGKPARWMGGEIIAASSYATSWSLCPAQAFRTGPKFSAALEEMPEHADIFIERMFAARMAVGGSIVTDPIIAGYWVQHTRMLHLQLNADKAVCSTQISKLYATLDRIMDDVEASGADWSGMVRRWLGWIPIDNLKSWLDNIDKMPKEVERGRYLDRVLEIMRKPIKDRERLLAPTDLEGG